MCARFCVCMSKYVWEYVCACVCASAFLYFYEFSFEERNFNTINWNISVIFFAMTVKCWNWKWITFSNTVDHFYISVWMLFKKIGLCHWLKVSRVWKSQVMLKIHGTKHLSIENYSHTIQHDIMTLRRKIKRIDLNALFYRCSFFTVSRMFTLCLSLF